MGLKKYILGSLILIIALFAFVFTQHSGDYRLELFDYVLVLPTALWIVAPVLILFVLSVLHILFYGLKNYFALKAVSKDSETFLKLVQKKLLNENIKTNFQNKQFKEISATLEQLEIDVINSDFSSKDKGISKVADQIFSIRSGKYISAKELKLDPTNPLMIQNIKNRIDSDDNYAVDALKKSSNHPKEIVEFAFYKVLKNKSMTTMKKHIDEIEFSSKMLLALLQKDSEQSDQVSMTNDVILSLIKRTPLTNEELIKIAKYYKTSMNPEQLLKLFEDISTENEESTAAYLYVLSEFEMVDNMRDILANSQQHEFIAFKALLDLKDAGKHTYSLDSLCYKQ